VEGEWGMKVVGLYSFNQGQKVINQDYPHLLPEIMEVIEAVEASRYLTKESREKTMPGRLLYNPRALNSGFSTEFKSRGWKTLRVKSEYSTAYYKPDYQPKKTNKGAFRELDFLKEKLGIEVQFGKYAFMVYNVCAKMTIFHNLGFINAGVEIVPIKEFADEMSTGVSYFEQFVWDLEQRGVSNIDIPVLILGITA
jgi:hypothetical protein